MPSRGRQQFLAIEEQFVMGLWEDGDYEFSFIALQGDDRSEHSWRQRYMSRLQSDNPTEMHNWTKQQDERLLQQQFKGTLWSEIPSTLGRPYHKPRECLDRWLELSPSASYPYRTEMDDTWSPAKLATLVSMKAQGKGWHEIAKEIPTMDRNKCRAYWFNHYWPNFMDWFPDGRRFRDQPEYVGWKRAHKCWVGHVGRQKYKILSGKEVIKEGDNDKQNDEEREYVGERDGNANAKHYGKQMAPNEGSNNTREAKNGQYAGARDTNHDDGGNDKEIAPEEGEEDAYGEGDEFDARLNQKQLAPNEGEEGAYGEWDEFNVGLTWKQMARDEDCSNEQQAREGQYAGGRDGNNDNRGNEEEMTLRYDNEDLYREWDKLDARLSGKGLAPKEGEEDAYGEGDEFDAGLNWKQMAPKEGEEDMYSEGNKSDAGANGPQMAPNRAEEDAYGEGDEFDAGLNEKEMVPKEGEEDAYGEGEELDAGLLLHHYGSEGLVEAERNDFDTLFQY